MPVVLAPSRSSILAAYGRLWLKDFRGAAATGPMSSSQFHPPSTPHISTPVRRPPLSDRLLFMHRLSFRYEIRLLCGALRGFSCFYYVSRHTFGLSFS